MLQDLRFAVRLLVRNRGFATATVLTLGLGIGLNGAVFALVRSVLLRPLPFRNPDRVMVVWKAPTSGGASSTYDPSDNPQTSGEFVDWRAYSQSFESLATVVIWKHELSPRFDLIASDRADRLRGAFATSNFFTLVGVQATLGRVFTERDAFQSQEAVISDGLWRRAFGADPTVIGRTIRLIGGRPRQPMSMTIIGVLPRDFRYSYPDETELWTPLTAAMLAKQPRRATYGQIIGRLRDGISAAQASTELNAIEQQMATLHPNEGRTLSQVVVAPFRERLTRAVRPQLMTVAGIAMLVLVIACVNVANLLLTRTISRSRELALRAVLGASRTRLLRQMLVETLLLGFLSAAAGIVLTAIAVPIWRAFLPMSLPRGDELRVDAAVIGFTFTVGTLAILVGAVAAFLLGTSDSLLRWLKEVSGNVTSGRLALAWRRSVVMAQVAAVFILLTAAGLMLRSFWYLSHVDLGYDGRQVVAMEIRALGLSDKQLEPIQERILQAVQAVPGVSQAAMTSAVPLRGTDWMRRLDLPPSASNNSIATNVREVSPEYQALMHIPVLSGRWLSAHDDATAPKVAVVSGSFAAVMEPNGDVLGKSLQLGDYSAEIVGVVGDVRSEAVTVDPRPAVYVPRAQDPSELMCLVLRTAEGRLPSVIADARAAIRRVAPDQPVERVTTLDNIASQSIADRRFSMATTTAFAGVALILAIIGLAGVVARSVSERTREIAVRSALGADAVRLRSMVIGEALRPVIGGLALGGLAAWWFATLLRAQLFQVPARDPITFVVAAAVLVIVAIAAAYLPARASTRIDPMLALRAE